MAQNSLRSNLSAAGFPLLSQKMGRSIILPQYDENFDRSVAGQSQVDPTTKGIPQAYYLHNVVPTAEGFQSVGYQQVIDGVTDVDNFDQVFPLRNTGDNNFLYSLGQGQNYIFNRNLGNWQTVDPFTNTTFSPDTFVSTAFVQGDTYICIPGEGVFNYDADANSLDPVSLNGIVTSNLKFIVACYGYMLLADTNTVYWSSATNPTDFFPSLSTGAGSGQIADAKGHIVALLQIAGGFMVYTTANVVSAMYSGNIRAPFIFKEVAGSGGIRYPWHVSSLANFAVHYAVTSSGVQQLDRNSAQGIFPEVTEFLSAKVFEDFDSTTLEFTETKLAQQLNVRIVVASDQYILVSYGQLPNQFTHALAYDLYQKRWGKLKIDHICAFEYNWPNLYGAVTYFMLRGQSYASLIGTTYEDLANQQKVAAQPKTSVAFAQNDGSIFLADFSETVVPADAVFIIGKYQMTRNRLFTLLSVNFDNVFNDVMAAQVFAMISLDGKNMLAPYPGKVLNSAPNTLYAGFRQSAVNVSLVLIGAFSLNTVVLNFIRNGQR